MKISYTWLQDLLDLEPLGLDSAAVAQALASLGLPIEGIEQHGADTILDVEVTSNRPDCLNHLGVARELAAHFRLKLKTPDFSSPPATFALSAFPSSVTIEASDLCPRYAARIITEIQIGESPDWLKERLIAVGQRPISNVVDITNYVLLTVGHPLHAFDYERLEENRIVVRRPRPDETIVTLDGMERRLTPEMLAICDARKPVALAGVMGGADSEISTLTSTVLLESAYFRPSSIRSTSKKLGLRTEASYRFERGADPLAPVGALNMATRLIAELAGGKCAGEVLDENPVPFEPRKLVLRTKRITQVTGMKFEPESVTETLERLHFGAIPISDAAWEVRVPSFRPDVEMEDDLVEELARHYGYDKIPSTYPVQQTHGAFLPTRKAEDMLLERLHAFGVFEAVNYVFSTPAREARLFGQPPNMVPIANPLTEEDTHLRTSLIPGLVDSLRRNLNHGNREVRLYEFGKVFIPVPGSESGFREELRLGIILTGIFYRPYWQTSGDELNFFHLKGAIEESLRGLGRTLSCSPTTAIPFLHPGNGAEASVDGCSLGFLGQLHPDVQEEYKFLDKVFVAELNLEPLFAVPVPEPHYAPLLRFPTTERDLSFVVDKGVKYGKIISAIKSLSIANLRDIRLIDLYRGQNLPAGKVSLAIRLTFADPSRTLTQDEVSRYTEQVADLLSSGFSAERRS